MVFFKSMSKEKKQNTKEKHVGMKSITRGREHPYPFLFMLPNLDIVMLRPDPVSMSLFEEES